MSSLEKKYQELIHCLEKNIKDAKELSIAKEKLADLVVNYSNLVSKSLEIDKKLDRIELNMASMHERINCIEDDMYLDLDSDDDDGVDEMHDNDFEFEIVCPYCQYEFITDSTYKNISEIRCPKCKKTIELDWEDEPLECGGHCHSCGGHCGEEENEKITTGIQEDDGKYTLNVQEPEEQENKKEKKKKDDNEDDM